MHTAKHTGNADYGGAYKGYYPESTAYGKYGKRYGNTTGAVSAGEGFSVAVGYKLRYIVKLEGTFFVKPASYYAYGCKACRRYYKKLRAAAF